MWIVRNETTDKAHTHIYPQRTLCENSHVPNIARKKQLIFSEHMSVYEPVFCFDFLSLVRVCCYWAIVTLGYISFFVRCSLPYDEYISAWVTSMLLFFFSLVALRDPCVCLYMHILSSHTLFSQTHFFTLTGSWTTDFILFFFFLALHSPGSKFHSEGLIFSWVTVYIFFFLLFISKCIHYHTAHLIQMKCDIMICWI